jgi:hypothetical protein
MPRNRTPKTHCIRGHARTPENVNGSGAIGLCVCRHSPQRHDPSDSLRCYAVVTGGEFCSCERLEVQVAMMRL